MAVPTFPIRTNRLLLRPFTLDDVDAVHRYQSRADVTRYVPWQPRTPEEVRRHIVERMDTSVGGDNRRIVLVVQAGGELVGEVNLYWTGEPHHQGEVGFVIHPDHQGKGYAGEAAAELLRIGFEAVGCHRIVGRLDARNSASARVLAKLGMRLEAHLKENMFEEGDWTDELVYAMLAREWEAIAVRLYR